MQFKELNYIGNALLISKNILKRKTRGGTQTAVVYHGIHSMKLCSYQQIKPHHVMHFAENPQLSQSTQLWETTNVS